jgi:hypothetical protein
MLGYGLICLARLYMRPSMLTLTQSAERLGVRPSYVNALVEKKRLKLIDNELFEESEVERLATLMNKLRHQGIVTLVNIADKDSGN